MFVPQHPWLNKALKILLQKVVAQVPIAGPILSDIVTIIWPAPTSAEPTSEELFEQIRDHVSALIEERITQPKPGDAQASLWTVGDQIDCAHFSFLSVTDSSSNTIELTAGDAATCTHVDIGYGNWGTAYFTITNEASETEMKGSWLNRSTHGRWRAGAVVGHNSVVI